MYVPKFAEVDDESAIRAMVDSTGSGWLVTAADSVPSSTLLPILWRGDRVLAHMARSNRHWRAIEDGQPALIIVGGPEAYVSPNWYPSKAEHGRMVPTWNYTAVHLNGTVFVREDVEWLRSMVSELTDLHESGRSQPWQVEDAPADYVDAQLRAIVGIEVRVDGVEAKAKLSQNRAERDRLGVIDGLRREGDPGASSVAAEMEALEQPPDD